MIFDELFEQAEKFEKNSVRDNKRWEEEEGSLS